MAEAAKAQNRYRVIERLESGGMAEVFRGEAESLAGFKKQVAIKRVLPHLAQNEKFIRMFLDEARLCARLNHASIVQVFDIGHVENTYFIVMEFVDGVNLKAIIEHMRKRNVPVPIPTAVFASIQVCNGLQYAHDLTDSDGNTLGIVHRDMSPPNVLISKRGEVKIVDFGLAKAAMQVEKTDPGVVKGKFSYLAPETAMGQEAGPQADIFAVGIMLWEMLSGRRLFLGDSDFQTVKLVQQANVPSLRKLNPEVPEDLENVIMKSLARDKAQRFQSAEEMAESLAHFLSTHQIAVTQFDIARIVKEVVEEKKAQAKRDGKREGSIIDRLIQEELLRFTSLGDGPPGAEGAGNEPLNPDDVGGGGNKPITDDSLIDPTAWAKDLAGDLDLQGSGGSGWRQPGLDTGAGGLADALEGDDLSPPQPSPTALGGGGDDEDEMEEEQTTVVPRASLPNVMKNADKSGGNKPFTDSPVNIAPATTSAAVTGGDSGATTQKKSSSGLIAAVAVVAIAGIGAALWFANVIPHH